MEILLLESEQTSRGMGGAGIGISHCAESTLQNPALITCTRGTSISFGGSIFMPDISAKMVKLHIIIVMQI